MEQIKALNALEPFLALSKSVTSPLQAADLVTRATSHPSTFLFADLLAQPTIKSLAATSPDFKPHYSLLGIFAHGTYEEYKLSCAERGLPDLNDEQTLKLRQLSLLTLARSRERLSYEALMKALGLSDGREVEGVVINAVYAGLVDATLDPHRQVVRVNSVAPLRDLPPSSVASIITALKAWSDRCTTTLGGIEDEIARIRTGAQQRQRNKELREKEVEKLISDAEKEGSDAQQLSKKLPTLRSGRYGKRGSGTMDMKMDEDDEAMNLDEDETAEGEKKRPRGKWS